jgi:glycosyltransferase involved in cell wall biosynthesis
MIVKPVLFVEKVFLKARGRDPLRGVEVFNLALARDLVWLGVPVRMPVARSWQEAVREVCGAHAPNLHLVRDSGMDVVGALLAGADQGARDIGVLLLGNVGKSLLPLVRWLRVRRRFREAVLIAHREASPSFVRMMAALPGSVVAVNGQIAAPFRDAGHPHVVVDYGVMHAERYFPDAAPRGDGPVRMVVLGMLDNAWKGADTAVSAFRRLPDAVRSRCELHLASFLDPPTFPEPNIRAYPWMPLEQIPDFLRRMDVMIVPSRDEEVMRETFSQAIVQGMLTGLPILASRLPVLTEKLDAGGGMVFDGELELAAQMGQLAVDVGRRAQLGAEARATALARYVWDTPRFARRYLGWEGEGADARVG